MDEATLKI